MAIERDDLIVPKPAARGPTTMRQLSVRTNGTRVACVDTCGFVLLLKRIRRGLVTEHAPSNKSRLITYNLN